jgi:hypothetical protein
MQRLFPAAFPHALQRLTTLLVLALWAVPASAEPYVYPSKSQSPEQQERDEFECYTWAKGGPALTP